MAGHSITPVPSDGSRTEQPATALAPSLPIGGPSGRTPSRSTRPSREPSRASRSTRDPSPRESEASSFGSSEVIADLRSWLDQRLRDFEARLVDRLEDVLKCGAADSSNNCRIGRHQSTQGGWDLLDPPVDDSPAEQNCVNLEAPEEANTSKIVGSDGSAQGADPNSMLERAVKEGDLHAVKQSLEANADPNMKFNSAFKLREVGFKEFSEGTPLAVAVLHRNQEMVKALLAYEADPDSTYAFKAGVVRMECVFPASHATVVSGDLTMLQLLADAKADLCASCGNNANLVWQAAYFGQVDFLRYLLDKKVPNDEPATSQDNGKDLHTPLHVAARQGHVKVVGMLLDSQVEVSGQNLYSKSTPLEDAIVHGHGDVVRVLVSKGAQLLEATKFSHEYMQHGPTWVEQNQAMTPRSTMGLETPLDVLFNKGNSVVIAKAAQGLRRAPARELDRLSADALLQFLKTPGKAPVEILRTIVRKHSIRYWDFDRRGRKRRRELKTALMDSANGFNVVEGPHTSALAHLYNHQETIVDESKGLRPFLDALAPQPETASRGLRFRCDTILHTRAFIDVDLLMVHVVGLSGNMEVLWALAAQTDPEVFAEIGCRAIVHLQFKKVSNSVYLKIVFEIAYLLSFCTLIVLLHELDGQDNQEFLVFVAAWVCLAAAGWEVLNFGSHVVGCHVCGLWRRLWNVWNVIELVKYAATTILLASTILGGMEVTEYTSFRTTLGCLVFLRWMKTLEAFRALQSIGVRILPIMSTMWEVGPFAGVLLMYLFGSVSAYYALGLKSAFDSFTLFYKIVAMGEVDVDELEGINMRFKPSSGDSESIFEQADSPRTSFYVPVRLLLIVTSFFIGLSLTNVFIAVLCISYKKASRQAASGFTRSLANIVIDHHTRMVGVRRMLCWKWWCFCKPGPRAPTRMASHTSGRGQLELDDEDEVGRKDYIWCSVPQEGA